MKKHFSILLGLVVITTLFAFTTEDDKATLAIDATKSLEIDPSKIDRSADETGDEDDDDVVVIATSNLLTCESCHKPTKPTKPIIIVSGGITSGKTGFIEFNEVDFDSENFSERAEKKQFKTYAKSVLTGEDLSITVHILDDNIAVMPNDEIHQFTNPFEAINAEPLEENDEQFELIVEENEVTIEAEPAVSNSTVYPSDISNGTINVNFIAELDAEVKISLYNMSGSQVEMLSNSFIEAGEIRQSFSLQNDLQAGIYIVAIEVGETILTEKVIVH